MDECIDTLGNAAIFTTLDCNSGYWKIEIDEADRYKTTFTSHCGLYRFARMPFGLKNAPATFQRVVDIILFRVQWQHALIYLDDVIVYSTTVEAHFEHVRDALTLLQTAGVSPKQRNCSFCETSVDYLGHVAHQGKLEVASKKCELWSKSIYLHPHVGGDVTTVVPDRCPPYEVSPLCLTVHLGHTSLSSSVLIPYTHPRCTLACRVGSTT